MSKTLKLLLSLRVHLRFRRDVIFDPEKTVTWSVNREYMNTDYLLFEGRQTRGDVETVILRGKTILENGAYVGA